MLYTEKTTPYLFRYPVNDLVTSLDSVLSHDDESNEVYMKLIEQQQASATHTPVSKYSEIVIVEHEKSSSYSCDVRVLGLLT